jgi:hypothetical protein
MWRVLPEATARPGRSSCGWGCHRCILWPSYAASTPPPDQSGHVTGMHHGPARLQAAHTRGGCSCCHPTRPHSNVTSTTQHSSCQQCLTVHTAAAALRHSTRVAAHTSLSCLTTPPSCNMRPLAGWCWRASGTAERLLETGSHDWSSRRGRSHLQLAQPCLPLSSSILLNLLHPTTHTHTRLRARE